MTEASGQRPARSIPWRLVALWLVFLVVATGTQFAFKWASDAITELDFGLTLLVVIAETPGAWLALLGYVLNFVLWLKILQQMDLSRAFPMTGLLYITVPVGAVFLFGEPLTAMRCAGIGLIIAGVVALAHE